MKKKIIFIVSLLTILFSSCDKVHNRTYLLTNNTGFDGKVFVHEFNDLSESINIQTAFIPSGKSNIFTPNENAVKIKIYLPEYGRWVQQVYYLEKDVTEIIIDGKTVVGTREP